MKGIESVLTIAARDHGSGPKVLPRKTKRIKLDRNRIILSKLTNIIRFLTKDRAIRVIEREGRIRERRVTSSGNRHLRPTADKNMLRNRLTIIKNKTQNT